jgi:hypothetical protein
MPAHCCTKRRSCVEDHADSSAKLETPAPHASDMGQPEAVKALFVANATDLRRDPTFQGSGLIDIMRTIQAV